MAVFNARTGSEPTDEYTPKDADNDVLHESEPGYWVTTDLDAPAPAAAKPAAVPLRFDLEAPRSELLVLHLRAYPAWQVMVNGVPAAGLGPRADGLLVVRVPAGRSAIQLRYRRTSDEAVGIAISLIALAVCLLLWRRELASARGGTSKNRAES